MAKKAKTKKTKKKVKRKFTDQINDALVAADKKEGSYWSETEAEIVTASGIQLPTGYLSVSQIEMYLRCPKQYEFRYVKGVKSPPAVALEEGSSHHFALDSNNKFKIANGEDLPVKEVVERFSDNWSDRSKKIENWEGDNADKVQERGRKMLRGYMAGFAPTLRPKYSERQTAVRVGPDVKIFGLIDVVGNVLPPTRKAPKKGDVTTIVDYKTVSRARSQKEVDNSLQLAGYSYMHLIDFGEVKSDVGLCCLVKTTGLTKWVKTTFGQPEMAWFRRVALSVANQISLGNFPLVADPCHWSCSERFCGYWKDCRGKVLSGNF